MSDNKDSFARSSAARAWKEARDANARIEDLLARLERIEYQPPERRLQRCGWCGEWSNAPACRNHIDLISAAELLEEELLGVEITEDVA